MDIGDDHKFFFLSRRWIDIRKFVAEPKKKKIKIEISDVDKTRGPERPIRPTSDRIFPHHVFAGIADVEHIKNTRSGR